MPKLVTDDQFAPLVELISCHPDGIGLEALVQALPGMPRRTLQRRLAELVRQQRLVTVGRARALRYRPVAATPLRYGDSAPPSPLVAREPAPEARIPFSPEGLAIQAAVRQPRQQRMPVGYDVDLLSQYHPNETAYLPAALREQLHQLGRSPAERTPAGTFARDILQRLLIDLSWASSHLEGNTYSQLDTERLIRHGEAAEGKDALETQMILNHKAAIEYLVLAPEQAQVAPDTLIALHALLSDGLMADPQSCGRLRRRAVEIGGSVYLPLALPQKIEELFGIVVSMAADIADPFEQAFFLMVHLPYLQPFEDVNKRVSRLAANIPFIRHNLCPLSFIDVPPQAYVDGLLGVYELRRVDLLRDVFVWAYARSCQQYVAVRQQLVPPDTFRLRYRRPLGEAVAALVREGLAPDAAAVRARLPAAVAEVDRERFIALVQAEFGTLHAGNAVRFGLRPLEYAAWAEKQ